jgi:O-acetylhomoserine (thiol)-lyase
MTEPVASYGGVSWWQNYGEFGFLTKLRSEQLRDIGASLSAMSAFLLVQGVETLPQRMRDHVANAQVVAQWLESDPRIDWVKYAGLASHPHNARAKKYVPEGAGSVFSFGVKASGDLSSRQAGEKFINSVQLASHLANIGDVRTLVIHPASTTHRQLTDEQLLESGVPQDLIRISVGLEDIEDILWDLDQALTIATGKAR